MLEDRIFNITNENDFGIVCLDVFEYQFFNNPVYQKFCTLLGKSPQNISHYSQIPFLPIEFFKSQRIITNELQEEIVFSSSGTTGTNTSKHYVSSLAIYEKSFNLAFNKFYGKPKDYTILALLPSYLERKGSSLIYMVDSLIKQTNNPDSGFYLNNLDELAIKLRELDKAGKKILLIGVSFALLDLIENHNFKLKNSVVMETGGMKGRRKEMIRQELHEKLKRGFGVNKIHSEYGMTELLSQAYSDGDGIFECPTWMKILIRDPEDALSSMPENKTGGINVIDLANVNSCSFIATQDLGKIKNEKVEILGRFDNSDLRGCNLLLL